MNTDSNNVNNADSVNPAPKPKFTVNDDNVTAKKSRGGQNESADDRLARMTEYNQDKDNQILWEIGTFLSRPYDGKRNLAQAIVDGETIEIDPDGIVMNGTTIYLQGGMELSQENFLEFACPACNSLHGSNLYPSKGLSAKNLAINKFFYNPTTHKMFIISNSCLTQYFEGIVGTNAWKARAVKVPRKYTAHLPVQPLTWTSVETSTPQTEPVAVAEPIATPEPAKKGKK
jgi:hypothetical protein